MRAKIGPRSCQATWARGTRPPASRAAAPAPPAATPPPRRRAAIGIRAGSFDNLIGGDEQLVRHSEPECAGGLVVDDELEFRGLHDRKVARLSALENATGIDADLAISIRNVGPIADKPADVGIFTPRIDRGQPVVGRQLN